MRGSKVQPSLSSLRVDELAVKVATTAAASHEPRTPVALCSKRETFLYQLQVAQPLPVVSLRATPSSSVLSRAANLTLLRWVKAHFASVHRLQQLGWVLLLAVVAAPRDVGRALAVPSTICSLPGIACSFATLSTDVAKVLVRQYEFWFFSVTNVVAWCLFAYFLGDIRALSLVPACLALELGILLDANFRTFVAATKSALYLEIPVLVALSALVFSQAIDVDPRRLQYLPYARVDVALVDILMNTLATVIVFAVRLVYNRRQLLERRNAGFKIVKCMLFRSKLVLRPADYATSLASTHRARHHTRGLLKLLGISSAKLFFPEHTRRQLHHQQQVSLVPLRLYAIDTRRTLVHAWPVTSTALSTPRLVLLYVLGFLGLALATISIGLAPPERAATVTSNVRYIPVAALACSSAFCSAFACGYQRDLLWSLLKNFGFLFPSLQFLVACLCLADMMQWDYRCWAIVAICLWFHWVLLLDTLTPPVRRKLRFTKRYATPPIVAIWLSIAAAVYAVAVLDLSDSKLHARDLFSWRLAHQTIAWSTKSLLLSRIAMILTWTARLFYSIAFGSDDELLFVRGAVDYYCPFDTFPGAPVAPSARCVVAPADTSASKRHRRVSYADSLLISYSSASKRHSREAFSIVLGRDQSVARLPRRTSLSGVAIAPARAASQRGLVSDRVLLDDCAALRRVQSTRTCAAPSLAPDRRSDTVLVH